MDLWEIKVLEGVFGHSNWKNNFGPNFQGALFRVYGGEEFFTGLYYRRKQALLKAKEGTLSWFVGERHWKIAFWVGKVFDFLKKENKGDIRGGRGEM